MIELEIITLVANNGVGIGFGLLMYRMASTTIKENTNTLKDLVVSLGKNRELLRELQQETRKR